MTSSIVLVLRALIIVIFVSNLVQSGYFKNDVFALQSSTYQQTANPNQNTDVIFKSTDHAKNTLNVSENSTMAAKEQSDKADNSNVLPPNFTSQSYCKCVIFRLDDVQDYYLNSVQMAQMDLFMSKNQSLSLGVIMNGIGNDSKVINKVHEGEQKGLFELALHGWNHVDYTKLSEQEQKATLIKANEKMQRLFGHTSKIFITPLETFNNDTIKAMSQIGLRILSAGPSAENSFDQNESVFTTDRKINANEIKQTSAETVYHLPTTITYKDFQNGEWIKIPFREILSIVDNNIQKYGYAVIVLHPQDLAKMDKNKTLTNVVDVNETKDLSNLIDSLLSKNIRITSFSEVVDRFKPSSASPVTSNRALHSSMMCSTGWNVTGYFTPVETDYSGAIKNIVVDGVNRIFYSSFLDAVNNEGWGRTKQGDYIGYYSNSYHSSPSPLDSNNNPLRVGDISSNLSLIPKGSRITIPTLPSPWNNKIFIANDLGSDFERRNVSVYLGEGKLAEHDILQISGSNNKLCFQNLH
jgi:peptidoglycan/xylan/chitin deacetylase (PgdA/CDA1 family)/3D (Asp-Asp-Asp) domain-containing protein